MKHILTCIFGLVAIGASAQSVTIRIVANDGTITTTNTVNVAAVRVQGLLALWAEDSKNKTNASPPASALTFGQFILQELGDKGQEHQAKGAIADMLTWGITNPPAKLIANWPNLTAIQKTNAANYIKQIGE